MFSLYNYGRMIGDPIRMGAYSQALRAAIKPGSVVLDLGTGFGIMAMLACQYGARHVYAIDTSDVINAGRKLATQNAMADRISFIQEDSRSWSVPEPVDVIVSDLRNVLPLHGTHIETIVDAKNRFLAPDGVLIPGSDKMFCSVIEAPDLYARYVTPWEPNNYGLDFSSPQALLANQWSRVSATHEQLITSDALLWELKYDQLQTTDFSMTTCLETKRQGQGHGLLMWFETELIEGVGFSTSPRGPSTGYGMCFFPFAKPLNMQRHDQVLVDVDARLMAGKYEWSWQATLRDSIGNKKAVTGQSTMLSNLNIY